MLEITEGPTTEIRPKVTVYVKNLLQLMEAYGKCHL